MSPSRVPLSRRRLLSLLSVGLLLANLSTFAVQAANLADTVEKIKPSIVAVGTLQAPPPPPPPRELLKLDGDESEYDDSKLCTPPQLLVQPGQGGHWQASGGLAVFPNPAKGQVEIKFPEADRERLLQVFNQQGILVRSVVVAEGQAGEVLSLDDVPSGIYHVSIKGGDLMLAQKLVVLK